MEKYDSGQPIVFMDSEAVKQEIIHAEYCESVTYDGPMARAILYLAFVGATYRERGKSSD